MERVIPDVFDDLGVGITLHDPETGEIVGVNERLAELYGYTAAELREMDIEDYSVDDGGYTQDEAERRVRDAAAGEPQTFEWHVERADGDRLWVRVRLASTTLDGDDYVLAEIRDITDRKQREEELQIRDQAIDEAPVGITLTDAQQDDNPLVYANSQFLDLVGYTEEEIFGWNHRELQGPETSEDVIDEFRQAIESEESTTVELRNYTKDGEPFWNRVSIAPLHDETGTVTNWVGFQENVTENVEREQTLEAERSFTQQSLNALEDAFYMLDTSGRIERWNDALSEVTGYTDAELDGMDALELFPDADQPAIEAAIGDVLEEGSAVVEGNYRTKDGREIPYEFTGTQFTDADGTLQGIIGIGRDITARKEHERRLTQLHEATRELVEADTAETVAEIASDTAENILGFSMNSVNFYDDEVDGLVPIAFSDSVSGLLGDLPVLDSGLAWETFHEGESRVFTGLQDDDEVYNPETEMRSEMVVPIGEYGTLLVASTDADAFDETDRVLAEILAANMESTLDRREQEKQYRRLTKRISDAYYAFDTDWTITYWNDIVAERTGRTAEELIGKNFWAEFPQVEGTLYGETLREAMASGEPRSCEFYYDHDDYWVKIQVYPDENGLAVISTDITDRKEDEAELERSNERLEQFAYVASHDLQEPLRTISNYIELVAEEYSDQLDEEALRFIDTVTTSSERMQSMLDGLLDYSRVTTRGEEFEPIDTEEAVRDTVRDLEFMIEEHNGTVEYDSLPIVDADPSQLRQLFQNLIKNALEHSGSDSVHIDISATETGDAYRFEVTDDGAGIAESRQEKIFRIFKSGKQDQTTSQARGIGLAICENIVSRHGGQIWVDSEPGEGSSFVFTIEKP